jgi:hypothetical protein
MSRRSSDELDERSHGASKWLEPIDQGPLIPAHELVSGRKTILSDVRMAAHVKMRRNRSTVREVFIDVWRQGRHDRFTVRAHDLA